MGGGKIKTLLLLLAAITSFIHANFDFGSCSGSGTFEQHIDYYGGKGHYDDATVVGTIPAGIQGLHISLRAENDVDIRLYDAANNYRIVHWPYGLFNKKIEETKTYRDVNITYSGWNGVDGEKGYEFISVEGTTPTAFTMKAFGYKAGYATVNYSWTGKEGCSAQESGSGTFEQEILYRDTNLVGTIPPNVSNVSIKLTSPNDLDIQLYAQDGTAIARWKPTGLMAGATEQSVMYHDMNITWSGYNGDGTGKGHEYIKIAGITTEMLTMKVYGYQAGSAHVEYSWGNIDTTPPMITLNGDTNITLNVGDTYTEIGATAIDDIDGNITENIVVTGSVDTEHAGTYILTYTVTDHAGNQASIQRTVKVVASSPCGIIAKLEYGNTAYYGYTQRYSIRLKTQPDSNVSLGIYSSDIHEGTVLGLNGPNHETLVFTPENWDKPQSVNIVGTNKNVVNGVQNYTLVLESLVSDDENYDGIDPEDIEMKGVQLKISAPNKIQKCIANLSKTITIETAYNGMNDLHYSLEDAPDGMTIDVKDGEIKWTPDSSNDGNSYTVRVKVTDGDLVDVVEFNMSVEVGRILQTEVTSNILTVIDNNSTLKGLQIIPVDSSVNLEHVVLRKVPIIEEIPDSITRITDIFIIDTPINGKIRIRLPLDNLPPDFDLMHESDRIGLYGLVDDDTMLIDTSLSVNVNPNNKQYSWMTTGRIWIPKLIDGKLILDVELWGLDGLSFVGYKKQEIINSSNLKNLGLYKSLSVGSSCEPARLPDNSVNFKKQLCIIEETNSTIFLENFGKNILSTRWNGATSQELISWIAEAQKKFDTLGLEYDKVFTISIEDFTNTSARGALGFVRKYKRENRDILHLNQKNFLKNMMQGTAVHEYFHHAQSRTKIGNSNLIIDSALGNWFNEGSARWFEDYVYDNLNIYLLKESKGYKILEVGLNAEEGKRNNRSYQRFTFLKLIKSFCTNYELEFKNFLNIDNTSDRSGIQNFIDTLSNASCNFGTAFSALNATESLLESAMYAYQYATVQENDISLLDSNEDKTKFTFDPVNELAKTQWVDGKIDIKAGLFMGKVAPFGAVSFRVNYDVLHAVDATPIFWRLKVDKDLLVVFTHLDKNNKGTTTPSSRGKMGLQDRFYIPMKANTEFKFNFIEEDMQGGVLVTLVNTSDKEVNIDELMMHGRFLRDDNKSIVTDYLRRIEWTDGYAGDGPFLYSYQDCSSLAWEGGNWSLPTLPSLNSIVDTSKTPPHPLVYNAFKNIEAKGYWADNWDYDLGTSTVVSFINGANVEIPIGNTMNHICTRFISNELNGISKSSENMSSYNQVIRD